MNAILEVCEYETHTMCEDRKHYDGGIYDPSVGLYGEDAGCYHPITDNMESDAYDKLEENARNNKCPYYERWVRHEIRR